MAATATKIILDTPAPDFRLAGTDGRTYTLKDVADEKGTAVAARIARLRPEPALLDRIRIQRRPVI